MADDTSWRSRRGARTCHGRMKKARARPEREYRDAFSEHIRRSVAGICAVLALSRTKSVCSHDDVRPRSLEQTQLLRGWAAAWDRFQEAYLFG
ncbi:hypothetical protein T492DRAFT_897936 [Pavlovales sp. CCMP2436]|nr:hypothetical protein T492DRAFT_897936 [Pavlovales sp. CCMP2436]